jgi:multiple sugar transport system substrate-binding protein
MPITRRTLLATGLAGAAALLAACAAPAPTATPVPTKPAAAEPTKPAPPAPTTVAPKPAEATTPAAPAPAAAPTKPAAGAAGGSRPSWFEAAKQLSGKTVNVLLGASDRATVQAKFFESFTKETGVKVNLEPVSGSDYRTKYGAEIAGRSGNYDAILIFTGDMARYGQANAFVALDEYLADRSLPDYELEDYPQSIVDSTMRFGGKVIGLSEGGACQIAFYRKDLLDAAGVQAPTTWAQVYDAAKKLKKGEVYGATLDLKDVLAAIRFGNVLPADLAWLDKGNRLSALRDPRTAANLELMSKLYREELMPKDAIANDLTASLNLYLTTRAATMPLSWPSLVAGTEDPKKSQVAGKTLYAPVPEGAPNASGWTWAIPVDAKEKKAAYLAMGWITSAEMNRRAVAEQANFDATFRRSTVTPEVEAAVRKLEFGEAKAAGLKALQGSWPKARFQPTIAAWPKVLDAVFPQIQKAIVGEVAPEAALKAAADAGDKLIQESGL